MIDYPWDKSLKEIRSFENSHGSWICSIPELNYETLTMLTQKCLIPEFVIAMFLLSEVLDQNNLDSNMAEESFDYIRSVHIRLVSCFSALALSSVVSTESLIWIFERIGSDVDVYDHALSNLKRRSVSDSTAKKYLESRNLI